MARHAVARDLMLCQRLRQLGCHHRQAVAFRQRRGAAPGAALIVCDNAVAGAERRQLWLPESGNATEAGCEDQRGRIGSGQSVDIQLHYASACPRCATDAISTSASAASGFNDIFDGLQHMAGLRGRIADVNHVVVRIERQGAGNVHHAVSQRSGYERGDRRTAASRDNDAFGHTEKRFDIEQRGLLRKIRSGLMRGVSQYHAEIFQKEAVTQRGLDADVGGDAGKNQMTDPAAAQHAVERGIEKAAVARFWQHDIARFGRQRIHQRIIPGAFRQQGALQLRLAAHGFQRIGFVKIGGARIARLGVIAVPAVLEPDNLYAGGACRGRDSRL
ncbi:hypothetical protein COLO4_02524 [Corchorus olitorius]|uniref:Uncharacterized protein n=1 Tax=Corchorus olitorius TaxID=93759 RepID=A0A1R3L0X3_9ROSI|nr:hypothetical protein COLO4_02524 [Corchorus olitorius]